MSFVDKVLTCRDCNETFVFTAGEQEFFAQKGFANEPRRCPSCRRAYKASRNGGLTAAGLTDRPQRTFYPAVCAACGAETSVPFLPRNDKPIFCWDCYQVQRPV